MTSDGGPSLSLERKNHSRVHIALSRQYGGAPKSVNSNVRSPRVTMMRSFSQTEGHAKSRVVRMSNSLQDGGPIAKFCAQNLLHKLRHIAAVPRYQRARMQGRLP